MKIAPPGLVRHFTNKAFREHTRDPAKEDRDALVRLITSKKPRKADLKKNQAFGAIDVGHGKGLGIFDEDFRWGGGVRRAFF